MAVAVLVAHARHREARLVAGAPGDAEAVVAAGGRDGLQAGVPAAAVGDVRRPLAVAGVRRADHDLGLAVAVQVVHRRDRGAGADALRPQQHALARLRVKRRDRQGRGGPGRGQREQPRRGERGHGRQRQRPRGAVAVARGPGRRGHVEDHPDRDARHLEADRDVVGVRALVEQRAADPERDDAGQRAQQGVRGADAPGLAREDQDGGDLQGRDGHQVGAQAEARHEQRGRGRTGQRDRELEADQEAGPALERGFGGVHLCEGSAGAAGAGFRAVSTPLIPC